MSHQLILTPRDPIIVRDGRPFGNAAGHRMKSLDWPYPSVLAGSLRTLLGKSAGGFTDEIVKQLKQITIAGPLPLFNEELYFPAPNDLVVYEKEEQRAIMKRWPALSIGGCDMPDDLMPVLEMADTKPVDAPAYWSHTAMVTWLIGGKPSIPPHPEQVTPDTGYLNKPEKEERSHVAIDPKTSTAADGMLYTTVGLDMLGLAMAAKFDANHDWLKQMKQLNGLHPFGGERRLVHWKFGESEIWNCPAVLQKKLVETSQIRLILATPGIFKHGWRPDWLEKKENHWQGSPPNCKNLTLRLVSACIERWSPISGWSLERASWGPKPIRRLAPAGSVYFFEVVSGDAGVLAENSNWLTSVCDNEQDRRDGFGLALWGIWNKSEEED